MGQACADLAALTRALMDAGVDEAKIRKVMGENMVRVLRERLGEQGISMGLTIGILIFDAAEEMDFVGPWEVLRAATGNMPDVRVLIVAPSRGVITCDKGLRVIADADYGDVTHLDVLIIPGGGGAWRELDNPATLDWLAAIAPGCAWVTSVCTGAFLLVGAGLAQGKRVTTHHLFLERLRELDGIEVVQGKRFVRDGKVVTAGGVMSGIDLALWLVGRLFGDDAVAHAKSYIAYDYPAASEFEDRD